MRRGRAAGGATTKLPCRGHPRGAVAAVGKARSEVEETGELFRRRLRPQWPGGELRGAKGGPCPGDLHRRRRF